MTSLPNYLIAKGDYWKVTIIPSDGINLGENISLGPILIGNSPPSITNFFTFPENPDDSDEISISYNFSDLDGDDDTSIRASADDIITFEAGAVDIAQMTSTMAISGSSVSTGSFGRVEATTLKGDGSELTNVTDDTALAFSIVFGG